MELINKYPCLVRIWLFMHHDCNSPFIVISFRILRRLWISLIYIILIDIIERQAHFVLNFNCILNSVDLSYTIVVISNNVFIIDIVKIYDVSLWYWRFIRIDDLNYLWEDLHYLKFMTASQCNKHICVCKCWFDHSPACADKAIEPHIAHTPINKVHSEH